MQTNDDYTRAVIGQIFGDNVLIPADLPQAPILGQYVAAITPGIAPLLAGHGVPTLGEELAHLLSTIGLYLDALAPGMIETRSWHQLILDGQSYAAFEELRREADKAISHIQVERELNFDWLKRPVSARKILWHLADHSAHHRGRLAIMMRLCGVEPPKL